jgi:hypothetical protein
MNVIDSMTLAYIAEFLDGDGSIFFQIIPRPDYKQKFQIRTSIGFYQDSRNVQILEWLKETFGAGYIRHRKTGISDYTVVESKKVKQILEMLRPYVKLKKKHVDLSLEILDKMEHDCSDRDFIEICEMVDQFKEINYSKKRSITADTVRNVLSP